MGARRFSDMEDTVLVLFDREQSRSVGQDIKSTSHSFSVQGRIPLPDSMFAHITADGCICYSRGSTAKVLGGYIADAVAARFRKLWEQAEGLHEATHFIHDSAVQCVLKRSCFGVCEASCILRLHGDLVPSSALARCPDGLMGLFGGHMERMSR